MKMLPKLFMGASVIVLVVAIILSVLGANMVAGPNGWLDLSLLLAIYAIASKYVHSDDKN